MDNFFTTGELSTLWRIASFHIACAIVFLVIYVIDTAGDARE